MNFKEYNYRVATGELTSISIQVPNGIKTDHGVIIYNKRSPDGKFIEKYVLAPNESYQFKSIDQDGNTNNTYSIEIIDEVKRKITRDDGRVYYEYHGKAEELASICESLPNTDKLKELLSRHPNSVVMIWTDKEGVESVYIIEETDDQV